jgi:hypothetical protein
LESASLSAISSRCDARKAGRSATNKSSRKWWDRDTKLLSETFVLTNAQHLFDKMPNFCSKKSPIFSKKNHLFVRTGPNFFSN